VRPKGVQKLALWLTLITSSIYSASAGGSGSSCEHICAPKKKWSVSDDDGPCIDLRALSALGAYDTMITSLSQYYAFSEWRQVNWADVRELGRADAQLANQTGDPIHLLLAVSKVISSINDGHLEHEFLTEECGDGPAQRYAALRDEFIGAGYGFTIAQIDDGSVIVTHVVAGSAAAQQGLQAGQVLTHCDGVPITHAVQQNLTGWLWAAKNPATASHREKEQYRSAVRAKVGTGSQWTVAGLGNITVRAVEDRYLTWNLTAPRSVDVRDPSPEPVRFKVLASGLGYLAVSDEEEENPRQYKAAYEEAFKALRSTPGLVVDIRGNNGGDDPNGATFNSFFMPASAPKVFYEDASYSNRLLRDVGRAHEMNGTNPSDYAIIGKSLYQAPQTVAYTKPAVLLIDDYVKSTGEGLAMSFARLPASRAQIVGFTGTAGSFGMSGARILLPGNVAMSFPYGRSLDADHQIQIDSDSTLRGGILPTVVIPNNATNAIAFVDGKSSGKHDIELHHAEQVLRSMIQSDQQH